MKILWTLFWTFAGIGVVTFGGGYAMLPFLERDIVGKRHWATTEELMDYFALGQCTPGMIAVNVATFVGYKISGFWGAFFATLGIVTPSFVIISVIAAFLSGFSDSPLVIHGFAGIRACVCVLILDAVLTLSRKTLKEKRPLLIFLFILALAVLTPASPVLLTVTAGVLGLLFMPRAEKGAMK